MIRGVSLLIVFMFVMNVCAQELDAALKSEDLSSAQIALTVRDVTTNEILIDHNGDVLLIPASSLKLVTTFTVLSKLGAEFMYVTKIGYRGELLADGTLVGDLMIIGSGDPSLASPDEDVLDLDGLLSDISNSISERGIKCITGRIIVDDSIYEKEGIHHTWPWDDLTNYYASGAYGFNFRENYYDIQFKSSPSPGELTEIVSMYPDVGLTSFENRVTSGPKGSGDNAYIFGDPYGYGRYAKGTIPPGRNGFKIKGAIPNPAETFSNILGHHLTQRGVKVDGAELTVDSQELKPLVQYMSPELGILVKRANYESVNLYCEVFLKELGSRDNSRPSTFEDGVNSVNSYLDEIGVGHKGLTLMDGSGLSLKNRVSTNFFTKFLAVIAKENTTTHITDYLAKTGQENTTLERFMADSKSSGKVWLKSGSLGGALSYTGIMQAQSGKWLTISLISNGHTVGNSKIRKHFAKIIDEVYVNN